MRYLAIDLGDKRTGLALGDSQTGLVSPLDVIEVAADADQGKLLVSRVAKAVGEQLGTSGELVIGLPLNMDGTEGPASKKSRVFGERLAAATGLAVRYQDERLTSADADWSMSRSGMTRGQKKQRRDALAAAAILRDYLGSLAAGDGASAG